MISRVSQCGHLEAINLLDNTHISACASLTIIFPQWPSCAAIGAFGRQSFPLVTFQPLMITALPSRSPLAMPILIKQMSA